MRIGIFGGSFSPVHIGHIEAAKHFISQMWLDVLFIVPAGNNPAKSEADMGASAKDRLEMCRRAFDGVDGVIVSDVEIKRDGIGYTVDTLRSFAGEDTRLFLLCGSDKILTIDKWRGADEIFKLSYPVYIRRDEDSSLDAEIISKVSFLREKYGKNIVRLNAPVIDLSSSKIRDMIARGEDISRLVPKTVLDYVKEMGLYGYRI